MSEGKKIKKENIPGVRKYKSIQEAINGVSAELERQHIKVLEKPNR